MSDNQPKISAGQNLALSGFTSDNVHIMPEQFYEKPPEKKKGNFWTILLIILIVLVVSGILILLFFVFNKNLQTQALNKLEPNVAMAKEETNKQTAKVNVENNTAILEKKDSVIENASNVPTQVIKPKTESAQSAQKKVEDQNTKDNLGIIENKVFSQGLDTDKDGLTDLEETLYKTESTKPDTDSDGFLDGEELVNLFNPALPSPALLENSDLVVKYQADEFKYSIFYPKEWVARPLDDSKREVIFASASGDFMEVVIEDNPNLYSPLTWYLKQFPQISASSVEKVYSRDGLEGIKSLDGTTVYFANGYFIYAINYNMGTKTVLDFGNTFKMMATSFKILLNSEENGISANQ